MGADSSSIDDLTICCVSCRSAPYLLTNYRLQQQFNQVQWIVTQNGRYEEFPDDIKVVDGIPRDGHRTSLHHALGLHSALRHVKTRYVLCLDPDFFILVPIKSVLAYLKKNRLVFFGAAYPSYQDWCYPRFPAAFCMMVDLSKVEKLDFTPQHTPKFRDIPYKEETGIRIYESYQSLPAEAIECHHWTRDGDVYYWQGVPFAVHSHMRSQKRTDERLLEALERQLAVVSGLRDNYSQEDSDERGHQSTSGVT